MTSKELVDYMYYRCLPKFYLEEDSKLGVPLYRYLQTLVYGGYAYNIESADKLMDLVNPETCPEEYVRILWESFGFSYYEGIGVEYYRRFLMNYGELVRRKGTYSGVRYMARVLTGLDVHLRYYRGEIFGVYGRYLIVGLLAEDEQDVETIKVKLEVIESFISDFVPYYITTSVVLSMKANQNLSYGNKLLFTKFISIDCDFPYAGDFLTDEFDDTLMDGIENDYVDSPEVFLVDEDGRILMDNAKIGYVDH